MCTNLVNSLECYMDDLVDCFEDFVKKSLIIISVAVGALVVMLGYVLKLVSERSQAPPYIGSSGVRTYPEPISCAQSACNSFRTSHTSMPAELLMTRCGNLPQKSANSVTMPCQKKDCRKTISASANTGPLSSTPSFDEKVLRNIGLSCCSKSSFHGKRSVTRNCSATRFGIPSMPTCIPNRMYTCPQRRPVAMAQNSRPTSRHLRYLASMVSRYMWTAYHMVNGNYLALATVIAVVLLSFLIPDISQKIHATSELKSMKKVLNLMTKEVDRAEVACLTAADEICYLQCSMQDDATETSRNLRDLSVCTSHCVRPTMSEPVQVEKKIGFFKRIFHIARNTSHKEIAIMSYVYTNSFDAQKTMNLTDVYDVMPSRSAIGFDDTLVL